MSSRRTAQCLGVLTAVTMVAAVAVADPSRADESTIDRYIVMLDDSATDPATEAEAAADRYGGNAIAVYRHALKGFAIDLPDIAVSKLQDDPAVASVEPDRPVTLIDGAESEPLDASRAQSVPTGVKRVSADENPQLGIGDGKGSVDVDIATIDSGIDIDHPDLNVVSQVNCMSGACENGGGNDGLGHGTHVSGTMAARDNDIGVVGLAPGARLHSVKVLDDSGSGSTATVIAGIDHVAANADSISVANMSIGAPATDIMDEAIANAVDKGIVFSVAACNDSEDAANCSPANHPDVVTVSALADYDGAPGGNGSPTCYSEQDDTLADFSNFGRLVEIAAPGVCINSTWTDGGYNDTASGTSMAAPHVGGAAAIYTAQRDPKNREDVMDVRQYIMDAGNQDWKDDSGDGVQEPLLDVGNPDLFPPAPADPGAPNADFSADCSRDTDLICTFDATASSDPDGSISTWSWEFGDGATGEGETPSHTYPAAGWYTARLTVTDNDGKTDTTTRQFKVGPNKPPAAEFTVDDPCEFICQFDGAASKDPDGSIVAWRWDFGDGTTGDQSFEVHRYDEPGTYTVSLTVTDDEGATDTATKEIEVLR